MLLLRRISKLQRAISTVSVLATAFGQDTTPRLSRTVREMPSQEETSDVFIPENPFSNN
jgi:hypothetical protein